MVDRRLTNLGFQNPNGNRNGTPSSPRTAINHDNNGNTSHRNSDNDVDRQPQEEAGPTPAPTDGCRHGQLPSSSTGSTGGRGRAKAVARSCLALSVARQADLWPLLRGVSEMARKNASGVEDGKAQALPVVYVAGELDNRYGGCSPSSGSILPLSPPPGVEAAATATGTGTANAKSAAKQLSSSARANAAARLVFGVGGAENSIGDLAGTEPGTHLGHDGGGGGLGRSTGSNDRDGHASPAGETVGGGVVGGVGARGARSAGVGAGAVVPFQKTVAGVVAATCPGVGVAILAGCGHAVPTEAPAALFREVANLSAAATAAAASTTSTTTVTPIARPVATPGATAATPAGAAESEEKLGRGCGRARIVDFSLEEFSIPMASPLQLSLCRLTERRGVLVRLEGALPLALSSSAGVVGGGVGEGRGHKTGEGESRSVWGVGEVTPLPGEHQQRPDIFLCFCSGL